MPTPLFLRVSLSMVLLASIFLAMVMGRNFRRSWVYEIDEAQSVLSSLETDRQIEASLCAPIISEWKLTRAKNARDLLEMLKGDPWETWVDEEEFSERLTTLNPNAPFEISGEDNYNLFSWTISPSGVLDMTLSTTCEASRKRRFFERFKYSGISEEELKWLEKALLVDEEGDGGNRSILEIRLRRGQWEVLKKEEVAWSSDQIRCVAQVIDDLACPDATKNQILWQCL